jgi:short-subunit dehydrogenase
VKELLASNNNKIAYHSREIDRLTKINKKILESLGQQNLEVIRVDQAEENQSKVSFN